MLKNNGVKKYTKKLLELFDIIKKKVFNYKKSEIYNIIEYFEKEYINVIESNDVLINLLVNSHSNIIKEECLSNTKICDKCCLIHMNNLNLSSGAVEFLSNLPVTDLNIAPLQGAVSNLHQYKYYNETAYICHKYFCK